MLKIAEITLLRRYREDKRLSIHEKQDCPHSFHQWLREMSAEHTEFLDISSKPLILLH